MIVAIILIAAAFGWLGYETDFMRVRLPMGKDKPAVKLLTTSKPDLMLSAGNPNNYPMTLTTTTKALKALLDQLSKTELTLTEEVYEYDYSDQA